MPSDKDVVIIAAKRTPQGKLLGALSSLTAPQLGSLALKAALDEAGIAGEDLDQVIFGQVVQAGAGQNPTRQTAVGAGVPFAVPTVTVNSVCLSGLRAVMDAARLIASGEASAVAAGGQESMSGAPYLAPSLRAGNAYGVTSLLDSLERDALTDAFGGYSMGLGTDRGNAERGISRQRQDALAAESHRRAASARDTGIFAAELAPVTVTGRKGAVTLVEEDEGVRPGTSAEILAGLTPVFVPEAEGGTITAGNASPISDGAAAVILARRSWAEERGLRVLATVLGWANTAGPDNTLHLQPARAIRAAAQRAGVEVQALEHIEINEAFASIVAASTDELGLDPAKVNPNGGAIALGHPVGASGARLVAHTAQQLAAGRSGSYAAVALCGGGGQGDALVLGFA